MTPLWLIAPAILVAGLPFLALAIARVARDVHATQRSMTRFAADLAATGADLRTQTQGLAASARGVHTRIPARPPWRPEDGNPFRRAPFDRIGAD